MATQMQLEVFLAENRIATRVLQSRDNKTVDKDKTETDIVSVSVLSEVLSLD